MSKTVTYVARTDGDVVEYGEARNAWGSAAHIWTVLGDQYQGFTEPRTLLDGVPFPIIMDMPAMDRLWQALPRLEEPDRWVLAYTFDHAMVDRLWAPTLLRHLTAWNTAHPSPSKTLDTVLDQMQTAIADSAVRAICWQQTTVAENLWWIYGEDEEDEGRPFNIDRDEGAFWLTPESLAQEKPVTAGG